MKTKKIYNFGPGPAILPREVIEKAAAAILNFDNMNLSILEISHRSKNFVKILDHAISLTKELLCIPETHEVLFLSGGASTQFLMTAINLLDRKGKACYIDTGAWANKAIKEGGNFGTIEILASSKDKNYTYIPKSYSLPIDASYLHLTSNNTIFGTQFKEFPNTDIPIVCDMSSDIFSRPIDVSKFGVIYAGAQKNLGPAGTTLVIVKKSLLNKVDRTIPTILNYQTHIDKKSTFNTPPVFPIYVSALTMEWIKNKGGVSALEKLNIEKATLLYNEIARNKMFQPVAVAEDRSLMNVTFVLKDKNLNETFLQMAEAANCSGIKGHRSVGGFRASIYNAMPKEGVQALINVMKNFEKKYAFVLS